MKAEKFLTLVLFITTTIAALGQIVPNEGLSLSYNRTTNTYLLSWYGHPGHTYFIQESQDLRSWSYMPIIKSGIGAPLEYLFKASGPRNFIRVQFIDQTAENTSTADFDTDGVSNMDELRRQTDPTISDVDIDGDGMADTWEMRHFGSLVAKADDDFDHDGISNGREFLNLTNPTTAYSGHDGARDDQRDSDHDGVPDWKERRDGSDPANVSDQGSSSPNFALVKLGTNLKLRKVTNTGLVWMEELLNGTPVSSVFWKNGIFSEPPTGGYVSSPYDPTTYPSVDAMNNRDEYTYKALPDIISNFRDFVKKIKRFDGTSVNVTGPFIDGEASIVDMSDDFYVGYADAISLIDTHWAGSDTCVDLEESSYYQANGAIWPLVGNMSVLGALSSYRVYGDTSYCGGEGLYWDVSLGNFVFPKFVNNNGRFTSLQWTRYVNEYGPAHYDFLGNRLNFTPTGLNDDDIIIGYTNSGRAVYWQDAELCFLGSEKMQPSAINGAGNILTLDALRDSAISLFVKNSGTTPSYHRIVLNELLPTQWTALSESAYMNDDHLIGLMAEYQPFDQYGLPVGAPEKNAVLLIPATLVADINRDGEFTPNSIAMMSDPASRSRIDICTSNLPFHFWINDDDDQTATTGEDTPEQPLAKADYNNNVVDSFGDLADFFPVYLDLKQLLTVLPANGSTKYKLKQANGALNFGYTNLTREKAFDYQKKILETGFGPAFVKGSGDAPTEQITAAGVELNSAFLDLIKNADGGVILIEGRQATTEPLVLSIEKSDGTVIAELKLHLKISPVEHMFRHVNLITTPTEYNGSNITPPFPGLRQDVAEPAGWPDSRTNGKYFVFLHGFNVDGQKARGWNAEVFKRLHALGSKARFVGVSWNGSPPSFIPGKYLDYHKAVFQAFQTGDVLADALSFTNGADVTLAAHSLGNMVASQAIQNGGYLPARYYMINAAVAIEAYSVVDGAPQVDKMVEESWRTYDDDPYSCTRLYASKWHELFPSSDNRSQLTWRNKFPNIITRAHNFFSGEEDVVANADHIDDASVLELITSGNISEVIAGEYSWKLQELVKGASLVSSLAGQVLERRQGGWRFNPDWNILVDTDPGPGSNWISRRRLPTETVSLTTADLQGRTFFYPFLEPKLTDLDASVASAKAGERLVKYDVLARGIPALSNAAAANPLPAIGPGRSFNMPLDGRANSASWPRDSGRWWHSDFKAVALPYVYPMYEAMIARGNLNQ